MEKEVLTQLMAINNNVFDLVAILYDYIVKIGERDALNKYKNNKECLKKFNKKFLLNIIHYKERLISFEQLKLMLKSNLDEANENFDIVCIAFINSVDKSYEDTAYEQGVNKIARIGPINSDETIEKNNVVVYISPSNLFVDHARQEKKFRPIFKYNLHSINEFLHFDRIILVMKQEFDQQIPKVYKRLDNRSLMNKINEDGLIKIGVVPYCKLDMLDLKFSEETFTINGAKKAHSKYLVSRYINILEKMINENINIAIFPELALTNEIYSKMKEYLKKNDCNKMELIFCGSLCGDKKNISYVLSGCGNELLRYFKKTPFEYKCDDKKFREELNDVKNSLDVLDVDGIGRILYTICKDYLDNSYTGKLKHILECNFAFVSAYSPSVNSFNRVSDEFCNVLYGITVLCNSCEPVIKCKSALNNTCNNVGYISVPEKVGTIVQAKREYYKYYKQCSTECKSNECYFRFTLSKDLNNICEYSLCKDEEILNVESN